MSHSPSEQSQSHISEIFHVLKNSGVRLDFRKEFFTLRLARLPREAAAAPSLGVPEDRLDRPWSNLGP